ncbi:MAG TPA: acetyl-CoA carboxylase biotin carboxyl carrier protein [Gemmatimonadota bacterium]|nr:acetyl-CoA carboxylase biotin carboxyl carrier protein [Gemmatimonadota bacterium]
MNRDELRSLIRLVEESEIDELEIRRWGRTVRIVKNSRGAAGIFTGGLPAAGAPTGAANQGPESGAPVAAVDQAGGSPAVKGYHPVTSPMVGTFYRSPAPEAPAFVEVGDTIRPGQTLCILEAMKLMNELQSDVSGVVRRITLENGKPVEYGQVLFEIETQ